ncbi:MAG: hypothetical protein LIO68_02810 [Rikenellaceae bacterium]|nr:hypothetical protein [Rikenellaceae bacterium]
MGGFPLPMTFSDMISVRRGECGQMIDFALRLFRAYVIPAAMDYTPGWANRSSGHVWNALVLSDGKSREIGYNPDGHNRYVHKFFKVNRQWFSPKRSNPLYVLRENEEAPDFFAEGRMEEVTKQYGMPISDITVSGLHKGDYKVAWLCTFHNAQWAPVTYASVKGRKAVFTDMARGIHFWEIMNR